MISSNSGIKIAIILPTIIFDWPFGNKSPVPELSKYWPMGFYLAVSPQYFITMFAPNTGPWASIWKKTAKHKPMSLYYTGPLVGKPRYSWVSSAYIWYIVLWDRIVAPRGRVYIQKMIGPKTDPCGTPNTSCDRDERTLHMH